MIKGAKVQQHETTVQYERSFCNYVLSTVRLVATKAKQAQRCTYEQLVPRQVFDMYVVLL